MPGVIVAILLLYPPHRAHAVKPPAVRNRRGQMGLADGVPFFQRLGNKAERWRVCLRRLQWRGKNRGEDPLARPISRQNHP